MPPRTGSRARSRRGSRAGTSAANPAAAQELVDPLRAGVIAFLVSLALLDAQVAATRLIAYRLFYHFVFFVVSLAQLGFAGSGAWVYASRRSAAAARTDLARWLLALAALPLAVLACYSWLGPEPNLSFGKLDGPPAYLYLCLLTLPLVALYFCGGMVLTLLFTSQRERIGRLYAADLAGASLGCAASVGAMMVAGPIRAFLLAGLAALAAACALARRSDLGRRNAALLTGAGLLATGLGYATVRPELFDPYARLPQVASLIGRTEWTHVARTDAVRRGRYVIDGDASTDFLEDADDPPSPEYELVKSAPDVAILGVGAGPQLRVALERQAASVLAIDINPTIVRWALEDDRGYNGDLFHQPGVQVEIGEGRHVLRSSARDFDVIVMHAIDTWTASAQGAYSLSENFLYTREAMGDLLSKLRPGGVVSIRRWLFWPPREMLRVFTTVLDALEHAHFEQPGRHVVVLCPRADFRDPELEVWGFLFFSNRPFDSAQLARLDAYAQQRGWSYLYRPDRALDTPFSEYASSSDRRAFLDAYPYLVTPATDSNPFFFQFSAPWSTWSQWNSAPRTVQAQSSPLLLVCLGLTLALGALLLGVPLFLRRGELAADPARLGSLVYFASLGLGFMAFELPAIQIMTLFLGHPTYALSLVLAGLLAGAGIGSAWMGRSGERAGWLATAGVIGLALFSAALLLPAVHAGIQLPDAVRMALTLIYVTGVGIPLGMPFVAGVRLLDPAHPDPVAWAWAVNGAAAVVGSCLLMLLMVYAGSTAAFGVAAAAYSLALLARTRLVRARRRAAGAEQHPLAASRPG